FLLRRSRLPELVSKFFSRSTADRTMCLPPSSQQLKGTNHATMTDPSIRYMKSCVCPLGPFPPGDTFSHNVNVSTVTCRHALSAYAFPQQSGTVILSSASIATPG